MTLFHPLPLENVTLPNRFVRSATYEGLAEPDGTPRPELGRLYANLARNRVGTIVTGFAYVSRSGRSMQPRQCGIDRDSLIDAWAGVAGATKEACSSCLLFMQIAHTGRQTLASSAAGDVIAPSRGASPYFRTRPRVMEDRDVTKVIGRFADAADRARRAGLDGVQIHAAHGYLVHQFLSPATNRRKDRWGRDRGAFLREIVAAVKERSGDGFPVLVKLSGADEDPGGMTPELAAAYSEELRGAGVDAVEVTHGTMDLAFNIFRGSRPVDLALETNPLFNRRPRWQLSLWKKTGWRRMEKRLRPFAEAYNREWARAIRARTDVPLILVGGLRSLETMEDVVASGDADAVALCRPLIAEPDLVERFHARRSARSRCVNCNECAVLCDTPRPVTCHRKAQREKTETEGVKR
ncbi:MAG: NADH:flavin oxidoreductase [Planctomycetota bacterium]